MSDPAYDFSNPDGLTDKQARILETYYALRQRMPGPCIGSREILTEIRRRKSCVGVPSEALIRDVLHRHDLPRRRDGRPRLQSKGVTTSELPFESAGSETAKFPASNSPSEPSSSRR